MGQRAQLHGLVRDLRQYLEWQAVPLAGSAGASQAEFDAWERSRAERKPRSAAQRPKPSSAAQRPRLSSAPASHVTPEIKAPVRAPSTPPSAAPTSGPALWKDDGLGAKPRKTFQQSPEPPKPSVESLVAVREELGDCQRCGLCEGRTNIVFGVGDARARLMFVGEAPGFNEDKQGEPFVGKAGELLDKMVSAMTLSREEIYIANVLKCRPPQNRDPAPDEIAACSPFLERQVAAVRPEVIVALGKFAANRLSGTDGSLGHIRGKWQEFNGVPLMPTYHPAYLLRNPADKRLAWDDLKKVMARLDLAPS